MGKWKDAFGGGKWKAILAKVAPTLATALGGPLAGTGVAVLSKVLLGKEDGTEAEIAEIVAGAQPEVLLKLRQAEQEFKVRMEELRITEEQLVFDDIASARERETYVKDKMPAILTSGISLGFIGYVIAITFLPEVPVEKEILMFVLGQLSGMATQGVTYYLGSSRGSKHKSASIDKVLEQIAENAKS